VTQVCKDRKATLAPKVIPETKGRRVCLVRKECLESQARLGLRATLDQSGRKVRPVLRATPDYRATRVHKGRQVRKALPA
jgi:hypothetical protein